MTTNHAGQDMSPARAHRAATAERVISRLKADPQTAIDNSDGGEAGFDFIRNARARNEQRTQAEKDASLRANVERVLAAMREGN